MKFLVSLLGLGISGGGVFIGTLQQNVLKTEKPYIDKLFEEIEKDIRKFSKENPLTKTESDYIKNPTTSSGEVQSKRKKRNTATSEVEKKESKNTLGVWTDIWVGLLSDYISKLWIKNNKVSTNILDEKSKNFSNQQKQEAIQYADDENKEEKKRFEEKLSGKESKIKEIYKKMKDFILEIEFPVTYKYNKNNNNDGPYENYIRKIS